MIYLDQWNTLSRRIHGLVRAADLHARFLAVSRVDSYKAAIYLHRQSLQVFDSLQYFLNHFREVLPSPVTDSIDGFIADNKVYIKDPKLGEQQEELVRATLVKLSAFETQVSFLLSDTQESLHARSELAFSHLQRLLVVDEGLREKWKLAFGKREEECEKQGAVHLLWHGIWAFKAHAEKGATDLVFQEPIRDLRDTPRGSQGLVLTEWKKADQENAQEKFQEACNQAELYSQGMLAGVELRDYRYAVVVSEAEVTVPDDYTKSGVTYRHINLVIDQKTPSKAAKKTSSQPTRRSPKGQQ